MVYRLIAWSMVDLSMASPVNVSDHVFFSKAIIQHLGLSCRSWLTPSCCMQSFSSAVSCCTSCTMPSSPPQAAAQ